MIKAIETVYNGYKFRSRLEARWAVFFDAGGVPYEYEPEGFDINGVWYLPDFSCPTLNALVEIKPDKNEVYSEEWDILCELCASLGKSAMLIQGSPGCCGKPYDEGCIESSPYKVMWLSCQPDDEPYLEGYFLECRGADDTQPLIIQIFEPDYGSSSIVYPPYCGKCEYLGWKKHCHDSWPINTPKLTKCLEKARQARFEHGETPNPNGGQAI